MNIRSGFSLPELLIVLCMMAFFAGMTAVVSTTAMRNAEFDKVREVVRGELVSAQADATAGTLNADWGVAFATSSITRYKGSSYASRDTVYDRIQTFANSIAISGTSDVRFTRPMGFPATSATIVTTNGTLNATTTVNTAGTIEVQ